MKKRGGMYISFANQIEEAVASGATNFRKLYEKFPDKSRPCIRGTVYRLIARGVLRKAEGEVKRRDGDQEEAQKPQRSPQPSAPHTPLFCECGGLMKPESGEMVCLSCGESVAAVEKHRGTLSARSVRENEDKESRVIVVDEDDELLGPTTDVECPECGHGKATWWMVQIRKADEPETLFYRCAKCRYTWRR